MDPKFWREQIVSAMRRKQQTVDEACRYLQENMGQFPGAGEELERAASQLRDEQRKQMLLDSPPVARGESYYSPGHVESEARLDAWYTGPAEDDLYWAQLAARMKAGALSDVFDDVNQASTKVVAHLANPGVKNLKKKGLVVGHVQSGKTANYAAVIAKAVDAGYRMVIVLSGMHNNLRKQTQQRLTHDITDESWFPLTDADNDFNGAHRGSALLVGRTPSLAVVKKNGSRLRRLRDFLREINIETRRGCPILIIDDEADQATPNTSDKDDDPSRINQLTREIWSEIPTGSYVGYTATPFANVFIDPDDETELYPSDFILALEPGEGYFGAERIFGRFNPDSAEDADDGMDVVRSVPEEDATELQPPSDREGRDEFDPDLPPSLTDAVRWFCLCVAIRSLRGQGRKHTSMLVHTTHYVAPHFAMVESIKQLLAALTDEVVGDDQETFARVWNREAPSTGIAENFEEVWAVMDRVLPSISVVADNGSSEDRLDYDVVDGDGQPLPQNVIAVGGGTLSRGLTLEGLVVSYFVRTSSTYDTLLQMGRWFGYRSGYGDLPRIWTPDDLREEFRFLAQVEHELREEIRVMSKSGLTPHELGLKIRAHPGRLSITAATKMRNAQMVRLSYAGQTMQTIQFHERSDSVLSANRAHADEFVRDVGVDSHWEQPYENQDHWLARDVGAAEVASFLQRYQGHEAQENWRPDLMAGWLEGPGVETKWNVVVFSPINSAKKDIVVGGIGPVRPVSRAPLDGYSERANIKALMSAPDRLLDLEGVPASERSANDSDARRLRAKYAKERGLLVMYLINPASQPTVQSINSRREMEAAQPLIGLGLVFPTIDDWDHTDKKQYYSVRSDWHVSEDDVEEVRDMEGNHKPEYTGAA